MRNLYSSSKGGATARSSGSKKKKKKVHPSPPPTSVVDTVAALALLPAALLALAAPLPDPDKEVLAYLISHSLTSADPRRPLQSSPSRGYFECYTSFWTRWNSSPHRDLINRIIEAFEDHLASSSQHHSPRPSRPKKRRDKPSPPQPPEILDSDPLPLPQPQPPLAGTAAEIALVEDDDIGDEEEEDPAGERRKATWPDVVGILNSRLRNLLWNP